MDSQSKQLQSLAERWRSLGTGARWSAGALLLVGILCIAGLVPHSSTNPNTFLLSGEPIPTDRLPQMEAAFAKANLSDYQIDDQRRIRVAQGRTSAYMAALAAADALPNNFGDILDRTMRQASPLQSRAQQEELIKVARQNELALIIRSMKGVERAAVLYDREKKPGLAGGQIITASITVQLKDNRSLTRDQVISFGRLVSGAIAGLEPRNVSVIDLNSGRSFKADSCDEIAVSSATEPMKQSTDRDFASPEARLQSRPPKLTSAEEVIAWAKQNTRTLALTGLAIVSLVVMSCVVRAPKARHTDALSTSAKSQIPVAPAVETLSPLGASEPRVKPTPEPTLVSSPPPERHDVAQLVRNDPHAAARVLRGWIGSPN